MLHVVTALLCTARRALILLAFYSTLPPLHCNCCCASTCRQLVSRDCRLIVTCCNRQMQTHVSAVCRLRFFWSCSCGKTRQVQQTVSDAPKKTNLLPCCRQSSLCTSTPMIFHRHTCADASSLLLPLVCFVQVCCEVHPQAFLWSAP